MNSVTLRVYKDIFKRLRHTDMFDSTLTVEQMRHVVQDYAQNLIYENGGGVGNIAVDYALNYLADVNWYAIALNMLSEEEI